MHGYHGNFTCADDVFSEFRVRDTEGIRILYAAYETADYEGTAHVVYEKDGRFFEVNASHCSCYGLEEGWEPEEIDATEAGLYMPDAPQA
jgi:hypothetical protein